MSNGMSWYHSATPSPRPRWQDVEGWFDEADAEAFEHVVREIDGGAGGPLVIVEIGSWAGRSTMAMVEAVKRYGKSATIIAVDTWKGSPEHLAMVKQRGGSVLPMFMETLRSFGFVQIVELSSGSAIPIMMERKESIIMQPIISVEAMQMDSHAARELFLSEADIVFVDATHYREDVEADLALWWPTVRVGGFLIGHDYGNPGWPGVKDAVDAFFGETPKKIFGMCVVVQKQAE